MAACSPPQINEINRPSFLLKYLSLSIVFTEIMPDSVFSFTVLLCSSVRAVSLAVSYTHLDVYKRQGQVSRSMSTLD